MSVGSLPQGHGHARFVIVRDRDGLRHAVARKAIAVLRETEDGETHILLGGRRVVTMADGLETVLAQLGERLEQVS